MVSKKIMQHNKLSLGFACVYNNISNVNVTSVWGYWIFFICSPKNQVFCLCMNLKLGLESEFLMGKEILTLLMYDIIRVSKNTEIFEIYWVMSRWPLKKYLNEYNQSDAKMTPNWSRKFFCFNFFWISLQLTTVVIHVRSPRLIIKGMEVKKHLIKFCVMFKWLLKSINPRIELFQLKSLTNKIITFSSKKKNSNGTKYLNKMCVQLIDC